MSFRITPTVRGTLKGYPMLLNLKTTATAAVAAFAIATSVAAPADAFGRNERKFFQGVAAAVIVGAVINEVTRAQRKRAQAAPPEPALQPAPEPQYVQPQRTDGYYDGRYNDRRNARRDPRWAPENRTYGTPNDNYDTQPQYRAPVQRGRIIGADNSGSYARSNYDRNSGSDSGLSQTPAAQAFNSYSYEDRRTVQRQLAGFGYYGGAIDGAFGPRTHEALYAFARTAGKQSALETTSGTFAIIDALLG